MIDKKQYLTTGEFAKLVKVTKDTLFHYDKIGLFCPEIKLNNEYRYYSIYQVELLEVILMLKELGMPLKEIKEFMDHRNAMSLMELFEKEEAQIDAKIKRLKAQKKVIQDQKKRILQVEGKPFDRIEVKHRKERYYLLKQGECKEDRAIFHYIRDLKEECEKAKMYSGYEIGFVQYEETLKQGRYDQYYDVVLVMEKPVKGLTLHTLEEGDYVLAYHRGHWESIGETYERMRDYIKQHQIETEDMFIETYVIDRLFVDDYNDYVTEISVKIIESTLRGDSILMK